MFIHYILLETARLLLVTIDKRLMFVRAVSIAHQSDRHRILTFIISLHLLLGDILIGNYSEEHSRFVDVVYIIKRYHIQALPDGIALSEYPFQLQRGRSHGGQLVALGRDNPGMLDANHLKTAGACHLECCLTCGTPDDLINSTR